MVGSFGLEIIYEYNDYLTLGRKATMLSGSFAGFNELTEFTVICKMKLRRERERERQREREREREPQIWVLFKHIWLNISPLSKRSSFLVAFFKPIF